MCLSVGHRVTGSVQDSDWAVLRRRHAAAGVQVSTTGSKMKILLPNIFPEVLRKNSCAYGPCFVE